MKLIKFTAIILFILTGIISAQNDPIQQDKPELTLIVKVKESIPIGYAYRFEGEVLKVEKGVFSDGKLDITVLTDGDGVYNALKADEPNNVFKITFVFNKSGEPYAHAFVTGFVDSEMNSWKIKKIEMYKND